MIDDELSRKIRAYVKGEAGADIFDARDRRHIRALLKEQQRKAEWLKDKMPCPECHGTGLETVANPDDAPIVKDGRGYRMAYCLHCHGMRYVTIEQPASQDVQ
jgi:hypothetical protein